MLHNTALAFFYMALPFTLSSGIFLIFFWLDVTSRSLYHGAFLDKAFWPAIILVIFSFLLMGISSILLWSGSVSPVYNIATIIILVELFLVSIIYFISARRVYIYTQQQKDPSRFEGIKKMMFKIILSGVVMIIIVILSILLYNSWRFPMSEQTFYFLMYSLFSLRSYLLMDLFSTSSKKASHSKSTSQPQSSSQPNADTSSLPNADTSSLRN